MKLIEHTVYLSISVYTQKEESNCFFSKYVLISLFNQKKT